jgi:hypothetical protein
MIVSKFIWNFFQEVIANRDNSPTKTSVLMYAYFQMLYNLGTLFEPAGIPSSDRVSPLKNSPLIKNYISKSTADLLPTILYIGHRAFMKKLYPSSTQLSAPDFGINLVPFPTNMTPDIIAYAESHLTEKALELQRAGFSTKNTTGLPADYTGSTSATPSPQWEQLIVPTGAVKGTNNLPLIVPSNPLSFKVQNFLGANFYKNRSFSVNPTANIIDLSAKISTTWEGGLKKEMDLLLNVYKDLDDRKKVIAEFFAGSSSQTLPPTGFFICIAQQLSQKYKQTTQDDLKMYFSLAAGIFDAGVSAWYYKSTYNQARPINLIRNYYANKTVASWTPLSTPILGKQWLPYQEFNFVTPPFPDVASGHSTFSRVASKILNWWFGNPALYDGFSTATMPNINLLCPALNINDKTVSIGEYVFDKGCSSIEPDITPKARTVLRYKTLDELASDAGLSRIYGGIHSFQTNEVSQELADWVYERTVSKLMGEFKFNSPKN